MDESTAAAASSGGGASPPNGSRFGLAPPRRFILPAVLLLLSEQPGYGYSLARRLEGFHFGRVDRPAVYRALAQLEADRLIEASSENPRAGQARRVYRVTPLGERVLRSWMGVVAAEHECLGSVLRRFQASHTVDAVLACVEGSWATALDSDWSALSPTWPGRRRLVAVDDARALAALGPELGFDPVLDETDTASNEPVPAGARRAGDLDEACDGDRDTFPSRFHLLPDCSVVLVEVRSTAGPLSFGLIGVTGTIECVSRGGGVRTDLAPSAHLDIDVARLTSGNRVYDAELLRRIDARRFPVASVDLASCVASGPGNLHRLEGTLTIHGVTRSVEGTVSLQASHGGRRLVITGEQIFDIRDFDIPSPTVLMLRIYPDVRVRLHIEAAMEEAR